MQIKININLFADNSLRLRNNFNKTLKDNDNFNENNNFNETSLKK